MIHKTILISVCATLLSLPAPGDHHKSQRPDGSAPSQVELTAKTKGDLGPYLADAEGRALYLIEGAAKDQSSCYGDCAKAWPPLLAKENSVEAADPKVNEKMIGTIDRRDGETQVSYNGHALYYYVKDKEPGQLSGHDYTDEWGEWYLVTPEGEPLERHGNKEEKKSKKKSS